MSQEEQVLSNGKLLAEYIASKNKLVSMRSEASSIAALLRRISDHIYEALPIGYVNVLDSVAAMPQKEALKKLLQDLATESSTLLELEQPLSALGLPLTPTALSAIRTKKDS